MKFSILIIDDEAYRHKQYNAILGDKFNLHFVNNPTEDYLKLVDKSYDAYIIDVVLPQEWEKCIPELDKTKPTIIVSSKWSDAKEHLNKYISFNIIHFFGWDEFQTQSTSLEILENKSLPSINNKIFFALSKYYSLSGSKKPLDEQIRILHISDLQLGDPSYNENSFLNYEIISNQINEAGLKIDLIAITGDISYSALPSEYLEAKKWINKLCANLFEFTNFSQRLLFVPGNHDISFDISTLGLWKFNSKLFKKVKEKKNVTEFEKRISEISDYELIKFYPFRNFCYDMTKNKAFLTPNLSFINDTFANWGLRFIHLNACELATYKNIWNYQVSDSTIENLLDKKNSFDSHNLFTIVLCHQGPKHLGYNEDGHNKEWLHLKNFLSLKNTKLFLHGHTHGEFSYDIINLDDKKMNRIQTGTLNLTKLANVDDHRNFLIIELLRSGGQVTNVNLLPFEVIKNKVTMQPKIELI